MEKVASRVVERTKKGKDLAVAVTGVEGDGKSCLSLGLGIAGDPFFELERNVLFSPNLDEIKQKIYGLPSHSIVDADEAIKIMYKLNWTSVKQKRLNQIYTLCRNQEKISLFNIPRLTDMNEYFRNHRVRLWIHIVDPISNEKSEGHAVLMSRSWNPVTSDPWGLKIFEKKMEKNRRKKNDAEYTLDDKLSIFSEMSSFVDVMRFSWVSPGIWKRYEDLKAQVNVDEEDLLEEESMSSQLVAWKERTVKSIKMFRRLGYSKRALCKLYDVHPNTLLAWVRAYDKQEEIKKLNLA